MIRRAAGFIGSWAQEIFGIGWLHFASPPPSGETDASISSLEGQGHQEQASGSGANRFAYVERPAVKLKHAQPDPTIPKVIHSTPDQRALRLTKIAAF